MKCNVCRADVPELDVQTKSHLLITKNNSDGHVHVHGDLDNKTNVKEMIDAAAEETGVLLHSAPKDSVPAEIVFHNRQRVGDMLVFTCGIRDFKAAYPHVRVNVISTAGHVWDHNPHIDRTLLATPENTIKIGPGSLTNSSNRKDWHFCNAFRVSIEEALSIHIPQGESRPDIYLTQEEYDAPRLFRDPYWVICTTGEKGWGTKMYPNSKWQEVIDQNPDLLFVQIGTKEDDAPRLKGPNVIDHIGKTQSKEAGIRDLFKLFLNAEGSIGLVSFHMHLSGALGKPAVVIAGAREPVHFTRYPGHAYLSTDGMLPCATKACWHCAMSACSNLVDLKGQSIVLTKEEKKLNGQSVEFKVLNQRLGDAGIHPKCVEIIDASEVTRAIRMYYLGGRLIKGVPHKPSLKEMKGHIVPTPPKPIHIEEVQDVAQEELTEAFGMKFGGGALTGRDWNFIKSVIDKYKVETVVEFGAGLSTLMLNNYNQLKFVHTLETSQGWITKIKSIMEDCSIELWDGKKDEPLEIAFDMAFVDGPAGDINREISTKLAAQNCKIVIVHDAGRVYSRQHQDQYLKPGFDGPFKGGHRCHLWIKKGFVPRETVAKVVKPVIESQKALVVPTKPIYQAGPVAEQVPIFNACLGQKFIKIVSTAKGWGGCARSVTTIIEMLLKAGHKVEFIPFRNAVTSSEWKQKLSHELKDCTVTADYSTLHESCDVLLVYADDYVWEFKQPEIAEAFSNIGADRKIMMSNFRNGGIGVIPWTKGWDKYMFLNTTQEADLLKVLPGVATKVLPPCTDLEPFFKIKPDYENGLRIVRHSSQGDTKYPKNFEEELRAIGSCGRIDITVNLLPGPSFIKTSSWVKSHPRTADPNVIAAFLGTGNLFWYSLPDGYMDAGPRVIIEAMAAGLCVVADDWGGAKDRIIDLKTGFLCTVKQQHTEIFRDILVSDLREMGQAGRQRAWEQFSPDAWIRELLN